MDEFTRVAQATSAALRTLSITESDEEAERARRVLEETHLPALGALDPVIAAASQSLMCDMLRSRARRGAISERPDRRWTPTI